MWDKLEMEIPFADKHVFESKLSTPEDRIGHVDIKRYDFEGVSLVSFKDGKATYQTPKAKKFDKIESSISSLAVDFNPNGFGFNKWPHVRIKASPAKIIQGHNVYGSENIRQGAYHMLTLLRLAYPLIFEHLDVAKAKVCTTDSTYSGRLPSRFWVAEIFEYLKHLPKTSRTKLKIHHEYIQFGAGSEYFRQKLYMKDQQLEADIKDALRTKQTDKHKILSNPDLVAFSQNLIRLEATTGKRQMERMGIPTLLKDFLNYHDWYESVHGEPLARYLWRECFKDFFKVLEGQTMINVDDDAVKNQIYLTLTKYKDDGKSCTRLAKSVYETYSLIKQHGFDKQKSSGGRSTFYKHVAHLNNCGVSTAFLKTLNKHHEKPNVIPIMKLIDIDFSQQRPDDFVEPVSCFKDYRQLPKLKLVS